MNSLSSKLKPIKTEKHILLLLILHILIYEALHSIKDVLEIIYYAYFPTKASTSNLTMAGIKN
jgi:hypothetical protein